MAPKKPKRMKRDEVLEKLYTESGEFAEFSHELANSLQELIDTGDLVRYVRALSNFVFLIRKLRMWAKHYEVFVQKHFSVLTVKDKLKLSLKYNENLRDLRALIRTLDEMSPDATNKCQLLEIPLRKDIIFLKETVGRLHREVL